MEIKELNNHITALVNAWAECNTEDVHTMLQIQKDISVYMYNLAELVGHYRAEFITLETDRKMAYYQAELSYLRQGFTGAKARAAAENDVKEKRMVEVKSERQWRKYEQVLDKLDNLAGAIRQSISVARKELDRNEG